jgi:hypothetical protein
MNMAAFERAQVAAFAYRMGSYTGSLDCMKAICYVLRNRVKAGWGDGSWFSVMASHWDVAGNADQLFPELRSEGHMDPQDRLLQMLVRDIDDIYLGASTDDTQIVVGGALYFQFIDQPGTVWFTENIVHQPDHHKRIAQIGTMAFFE